MHVTKLNNPPQGLMAYTDSDIVSLCSQLYVYTQESVFYAATVYQETAVSEWR